MIKNEKGTKPAQDLLALKGTCNAGGEHIRGEAGAFDMCYPARMAQDKANALSKKPSKAKICQAYINHFSTTPPDNIKQKRTNNMREPLQQTPIVDKSKIQQQGRERILTKPAHNE